MGKAKSRKPMTDRSTETIITSGGIIAISRGNYGETLLRSVDALLSGGVRAVEVTFEQNGDPERTAEAIRSLVTHFGDTAAIGAGTVARAMSFRPIQMKALSGKRSASASAPSPAR